MLFVFFLNFILIGQSASYSSCTTLATGYNTLSGNVAAGGHCFWFNSNTELDCKGYTITGPSGAFGLLANINKNNLTIRNCKITNFQLGTYIDTSTNIKIINSTFYGNQHGIYTQNANSNVYIENSTTYSNSGSGVQLGNSGNSDFSLINHVSYGNTASGVLFYNVDNVFVKNLTSYSNQYGLYIDVSTGVNVSDVNLYDNFAGFVYSNVNSGVISDVFINNSPTYAGILFQNNARNSVFNNVVSSNSQWGVVYQGSNITFDNFSSDKNSVAFYIVSGDGAKIKNSNFSDSTTFEIKIDVTNKLNMCSHNFSNVIGSLGYPVKFFNSSVSLSDEILSQLILCDADNSDISNVSIYGKNGYTTNGLMNFYVDNSNFTNLKFNNSAWGLHFQSSTNNLVENVSGFNGIYGVVSINSSYNNFTNLYLGNMVSNFLNMGTESNFNSFENVDVSNSSAGSGIQIFDSNDNLFINISISYSNAYSGLYLMRSSRNDFYNVSSSFNFLNGVVVYNNSNYNNFTNVNLFENKIDGILFGDSVGGVFSYINSYLNNLTGFKFSTFTGASFNFLNSYSNSAGGLLKIDSNNLVFDNINFSNNLLGDGLYFNSSSNAVISNSNFDNNGKNGLVANSNSTFISLVNSSFKDNVAAGIGVGFGSNISTVNLEVYSNLLGILIEDSSNNDISDSNILGNVGGIYFRGDSDDSVVYNSSVYSNFLGDVYFSRKNITAPTSNILFGNTFDTVDKVFSNYNFSSNLNHFNSSSLGLGNVGNFWSEFNCGSTVTRGIYFVCLTPSNLLINSLYSIYDYAPLSNHPGFEVNVSARTLDYVYPTFPSGTKFSKSNFTIKFGDGVTNISPCLVKVNNLVGGVTFSDGYCTLSVSNISGIKSDFTFQAYSNQFSFEERTITYYPNPSYLSDLPSFGLFGILFFVFVVGLVL